MADAAVDVSIVLAVYNEEQSIAKELSIIKEAMSKSKFSYEIIVVDDASLDNTLDILKGIEGIKLITHNINKGTGVARKTGMLASKGRIIIWTDSDLTYPNQLIPRLAEQLESSNFRQIIGARSKETGSVKFLRVPAKYVLKKLASFLTKTNIPDLNSAFRAFYREDGLKFIFLLPNGFSCTATMTLAFLCNGLDVGYEPIEYKKRMGNSKFNPIKDSYNYLIQVIRMITYFEPLRVFVPFGIVIFFISLIKTIFNLVIMRDIQLSDVIGFFAAFLVFSVGLLANFIVTYNKKYFYQQK